MKRYIRSTTIITKEQLLAESKSLRGSELEDAIYRADSLGSYYREDKRQKRSYIEGIVRNMWVDDPQDLDDIDNNLDVLFIVRNIPKYSKEAKDLSSRWQRDIYGEDHESSFNDGGWTDAIYSLVNSRF